jgi:serine/threonine-protein kinase
MGELAGQGAAEANARLGQPLGDYTLTRLVGIGGMGAVYEATPADGSDPVAIKVLHHDKCARPEIRKRFAQESMAAKLIDHAGVVKVLGNGEASDGTPYLVMELLDGDPLGVILRRSTKPLPISRLLDILDQVLDALAVAHARGVVHRDIKPDNLFITTEGQVKVVDFGVARLLEDTQGGHKTSVGVTLGTVPFMSPEQALGKRTDVDGRSDLFSLGAMTFRLVARRNLHIANSDAELLALMATKAAPPLRSVCPTAPPQLASFIDVALAFSKESRYPDAKTMQTDVRALREGKAPPYATRITEARDMATRALAIPSAEAISKARAAAIAEGTAPADIAALYDDVWPDLEPPPASSEWPDLEEAKAEAPPSPPPSSRNVMAMQAMPERVDVAKTAPLAIHAEPTNPISEAASSDVAPPAAPVPTTPPRAPSSSGGSSGKLFFLGLFVVALAGFAAYHYALATNPPPAVHAPAALPAPVPKR